MNAKIGRNDPCPCGSGLKYKKCCLDKDESLARRSPQAEYAAKVKPAAGGAGVASPFLDEGPGRGAGGKKLRGADDFDFNDGFDDEFNDGDENYDDDEFGEDESEYGAAWRKEKREREEALRAKTPDELFAEIKKLGLPVTREILAADAAKHDSVIDMCVEWQKRYQKTMKTAREEEALWDAARMLWEKLEPAGTPCLEKIYDEITEGYGQMECEGDEDAALESWLAAWDKMKASLGRISRTFDEIDRQIATPEGGLEEWAGDICDLLADLAEDRGGDEYETRRRKFLAEFVSAFQDFPDEVAVGLKCDQAERSFDEGKAAEADAAFEALAAEYPRCHQVYERWAAAYSGEAFDEDNPLPPDLQKARSIVERGIAVENIDDRFELLDTVREINSRLLKAGRLAGAELEASRAAADFEKKYKRATLEEKLNMLDEFCIGDKMRGFERFVEPVHFYESLAWDLADAGMIDEALGLTAMLQLRQPALYEYHFATFEYIRAMVELAEGNVERAGRAIERLLDDDPPCYEYIALITRAAAAAGMEDAVGARCLAAARHYFRHASRREDDSGHDLKYLAAAFIFGETFAGTGAGENVSEKDLELKLFMAGWSGSSVAAAKCFVEEFAPGRAPVRLEKNSLWNVEIDKFLDKLFRMSLHYFKRMRVEKGRGFVMSSIVWGFVIDFLMRRAAKSRQDPDLEKFFKFDKYELKDFALARCRSFGDEKDKLPDTAASLKLMSTVFEHLRDCGAVDDETCGKAAAAAEWTLAKLIARHKKRAWQLGFVERL